MSEDLKRGGCEVHPVVFASGTFASPTIEVLVGVGGLTSLAGVLRVWFHRHDGKRIHLEFNGHTIDIEGMGDDELDETLKSLSKLTGQPSEEAEED